MSQKNNLLDGSIFKSLISLAVPIIFANILQTTYQLIDTFWVGRLGTDAVAAVSISFPVIFLIISLGGGLVMAGAILIAQYKGSSNRKAVNHIASQTFVMVVVISIVLAMIGYLLSPLVVRLMGADTKVYTDAVLYMRVSFLGMIFMFVYMAFQSLMRGVGDVKTPLYIVLGTVFLNLVLDPLFIFGYGIFPGYGVTGAAIATIITEGLAALIGSFLLLKGRYHIKIFWKDLYPDISLIKKMMRLGFPSSIEQSTRALGMIAMTFLVASFDTLTIAAYGIGSRILSFVIIPALGLSMATSTLVGQNMGAGKIQRAKSIVQMSSWVGFIGLSLIGLLFFIFAQQISSIFIPDETETIVMSASFLKIMSLTYGFIGLQMAINGSFRGSGNTFISMMLAIISMWVLRFPLAYLLSNTNLGQIGIWIAFPVSNIIAGIIAMIWYVKGDWATKVLTEEIKLTTEATKEALIQEGSD